MTLEVGSRLGHYDVTALIGEGGMGQVYQATDTKVDRQGKVASALIVVGLRAIYLLRPHETSSVDSHPLRQGDSIDCPLEVLQILSQRVADFSPNDPL